MKKLKNILLYLLSLVLVAGLAVGGTVAYLSDDDSAVNVMTLGNVYIRQNEQQRVEANGEFTSELENFKQGKILMPVTYPGNRTADTVKVGDYEITLSDNEANYVDKIVSVTNTGKSEAFVRTLVAVPTGGADWEPTPVTANNCWLHWNLPADYADHWTLDFSPILIEVDGIGYYVWEFTHNEALAPNKTTYPSVRGFYMDQKVDNDDNGYFMTYDNGTTKRIDDIKLNDTVDILVLSQAVQAAGFDDAATALNTAFGTTADNAATWFGGMDIPNYAITASEVNAVLTSLPDGSDITKNVSKIVYGKTSEYPEIVNGGYETAAVDNATAYYVPNGDNYDVYMLADGVIFAPVNSRNLFMGMSNVTEIDTSNLDFSHVQNALGMFANCSRLEKLDTENWDVSNITNMQSIFYGCNSLKDIDVSEWDTSNVTNMRMVFFRCYALDNETLKGVENWDVSNVTNFYSMFKHARGLTSLDLSKWNTSKATTMSHMFANIGGLLELDLSGFDTSNVTDMSWMFYDASKLTTIYVGDGWTTANVDVENTSRPFYNNQSLVGEKGTDWLDVCDMANPNRPWESSAKIDYAIVDNGTDAPGLLTYKAN